MLALRCRRQAAIHAARPPRAAPHGMLQRGSLLQKAPCADRSISTTRSATCNATASRRRSDTAMSRHHALRLAACLLALAAGGAAAARGLQQQAGTCPLPQAVIDQLNFEPVSQP
jgi:hypothetical protein